MTIDSATPIQIHTVAGIGPYAAGWPYADGGIFVGTVGADGTVTWLASSNYTVTPASSDTSGNVFLAPAAAAALDGQILYLERNTAEEQGWTGHLSARERGLENQLDIMVMSAQERRSLADRSLRATVPIAPFVPGPAGTVLIRTETGYGTGPDGAQIAAAQAHASAANLSAAAAAQSAAEALAKENSMLRWRGAWQAATAYEPSDIVHAGGSAYVCVVAHTSNTGESWGTVWNIFAQQGAAGPGSGDMLKSENLAGLASRALARANLDLGGLAVKNKATVPGDMDASGTPADWSVLFGDGAWRSIFGLGVQWLNLTGSRAKNTVYQNTNGRAIKVNVISSGGYVDRRMSVSPNNITWGGVSSFNTDGQTTSEAVVPSGHYYRFEGGATIEWWLELRS